MQLPFAGGWNDQPTWVTDGFDTLLAVGFWHSINDKLPSTDGLPKLEDS